ncbi:hypothetical protein AC1031_005539 [Aphanomyces cochlioides]|nr:hypothetical protein AC1031_005539 [Aphanomyces cochlioides]
MTSRGPNYRPYEDKALCQAWVDLSTDAIIGRNQEETQSCGNDDSCASSDNDNDFELRELVPEPQRPIGIRRAQAAQLQQKLLARQVAVAETMASTAVRRIAVAEEYNEMHLFQMQPPDTDLEAQEYVRLRRAEVLARLRLNNSNAGNVHNI